MFTSQQAKHANVCDGWVVPPSTSIVIYFFNFPAFLLKTVGKIFVVCVCVCLVENALRRVCAV